jgi:hypothetical protein
VESIKLKEMRVFAVFIGLSLVFHVLLLALIMLCKTTAPNVLPFSQIASKQPVEVVYVQKNKKQKNNNNEKTFVKQLQVPDELKFEDPNEAQFSSEQRQRVLQQTRAVENGLTKNREHGPRFLEDDEQTKAQKQREEDEKRKLADKGDFTIFNPKQELDKMATSGGGESTISVKLPDNIATGSFTALNTDRNVYYSFYSRLEDMIYLRWSDLISKAVESYSLDSRRRKLGGRSWRTDVVILLKPNGEFYQAQVFNSSGIEKFDISPALAFQDARIFPNPPQEMVRDDGYIHISYSFVVDFGQVQ